MAKLRIFAVSGTVAALFAAAALGVWISVDRHSVDAADRGAQGSDRLIYSGYTEAPGGTVLASGEVRSGQIVLDLRVAAGDQIKRGDVIAVLSNYPIETNLIRLYEAELEKAKLQREAMVSGYRPSEIAMQEVVARSALEKSRLKELELQRSSNPPEQKRLSLAISREKFEKEQAKLKMDRESLAEDLLEIDDDIRSSAAKLDKARAQQEQALVRSPIDGLVVQVDTRRGEKVLGAVAKIVDMSQIRVLVDVNEVNIDRVTVGQRVEVTFRGDKTIFGGTVARIPPLVKRLQRAVYALGTPGESRVVTVEIKFDDLESVPKLLGLEAAVTFL